MGGMSEEGKPTWPELFFASDAETNLPVGEWEAHLKIPRGVLRMDLLPSLKPRNASKDLLKLGADVSFKKLL